MARALIQSGSRARAAAAAIGLGICGTNFNFVERVLSGLNGIGALAETQAYKFMIPFRIIAPVIGE
jgi:hypothetical protein